jgi:hypothetical protein
MKKRAKAKKKGDKVLSNVVEKLRILGKSEFMETRMVKDHERRIKRLEKLISKLVV